ncbi:Transposon Ty3-G Gag-Pol polyprotein [Thelohanellus kitauei]|nr:Transposon Ty3-G Gag-Pol polyprotein [Thelohanellus kitauei]
MAIVWSFKKFRPYLLGSKFLLRTDHKPLKSIQTNGDIGGQMARWLDLIAEYSFDVVYRRGIDHINADTLSRYCCSTFSNGRSETLSLESALCCPAKLRQLQLEDNVIAAFLRSDFNKTQNIYTSGNNEHVDILYRQSRNLVLKNGILFRRYDSNKSPHLRLVLPQVLIPQVLNLSHDKRGHMGYENTLHSIINRFYWPKMRVDVKNYVDSCPACCSRNDPSPKVKAKLVQNQPKFVLERVAMDILGPLTVSTRGNKYVLVISDYYSKFVDAFPLSSIDAKTISNVFVNEFALKYGIPNIVHTDQGTNFDSEIFRGVCSSLGIQKTRTSPYHPQSDGLVERFNRTLVNMISKSINSYEEWEDHLSAVVFAYNTTKHSSTQISPFELMFKRFPKLPIDVAIPNNQIKNADWPHKKIQHVLKETDANLRKSQASQELQYNKKLKELKVNCGDQVYVHYPHLPDLSRNKLARLWRGPYEVTKITWPILHINIGKKTTQIHVNRCKIYDPRKSYPKNNGIQNLISEKEREKPSSEEERENPVWLELQSNSKNFEYNILPDGTQPRRSTRIRRPVEKFPGYVEYLDNTERDVTSRPDSDSDYSPLLD